MTEKNFFQQRALRFFAIPMLLFLLIFGIAPGAKAHAAESQQSSINNLTYTFTSTDGTSVSTKANPNETTVLIFGYTTCSKTRSTLNSISSCEWVKRPDIRTIFVDTKGHTQEEVNAYKEGYQCPEMIFCYDEGFDSFSAMAEYGQLFGINGGTYPTIVLIDKDNKVQNLLTGPKTANDVIIEIQKFANIEGEGLLTPPTGSDTGIENIVQSLKTIENTTISTKANANETTVLIFGYTSCGLTKATLQSISGSSWVGRQDIRVIFADVYGASLDETKAFADTFSSKDILFCYDESILTKNLAFSYLGLYNQTGGQFPFIVLIDKNNKVQSLTLGLRTEAEIFAEIEKLQTTTPEPGTPIPTPEPGTSTPTPTPGPGTSTPAPAPSVPNVSGLKASYTNKNVKLTWKKVPKANGYMIYQYNSSQKKWVKKDTIKTNTASYTVKKLTPSTGYRFAVKAYILANDGKQATSKSYTSLYTSTAPNAVDFKVKPGKKKATVKWTKVKGATGYTVYYKVKAKDPWKKLKSTKGTSYTKKKLKSGTTYIFTVKAYKTYKGSTYTSSFQTKKVKVK